MAPERKEVSSIPTRSTRSPRTRRPFINTMVGSLSEGVVLVVDERFKFLPCKLRRLQAPY
jgi:hypothetical protein